MGATPLCPVCVCVYGCNATFSRLCMLMDITPLFYACVWRENVALHPLTHTQTWISGVTPINTHTNVNKWRYTHKHTHTRVKKWRCIHVCELMGVTPLFHVCVCVNGCNATFLRVCVYLWVQRNFFTFVCLFMGVTPLCLVCVCVLMGAT
jgi:hypothetical protein